MKKAKVIVYKKNSTRIIYYIPWSIFTILNTIFLFIIFILRNVGKGVVFINNHIAKTGDHFGDLAKNDEKLDDLIAKLQAARKK